MADDADHAARANRQIHAFESLDSPEAFGDPRQPKAVKR